MDYHIIIGIYQNTEENKKFHTMQHDLRLRDNARIGT